METPVEKIYLETPVEKIIYDISISTPIDQMPPAYLLQSDETADFFKKRINRPETAIIPMLKLFLRTSRSEF